jgi:ring-1,2-phenylacetyl-CoA epoxidase subunit PaaE
VSAVAVRRRPVFHALAVTTVDRLTDDAVVVGFTVPVELREPFRFAAGQHVTVRRKDGAAEVRRSYSICSTPRELADGGRLRIGVRQVPGGVFSTFAVGGALRPGASVEVLPPLGHFTTPFDPTRARHYAAIAAGSGITPVLSLLATALSTEPGSRFTLIFGNRYTRSAMFIDELADLKDRYPTRCQLIHVLSREPRDAELLSGRLDPDRLTRLFAALVDPAGVDEWFLCGPHGLVVDAQAVLAAHGVPLPAVHTELFHVGDEVPVGRPIDAPAGASVTLRLDGRESTVAILPGERVLDAALRVRPELPYACRGGVCATCRAKVLAGEVSMVRNFALEPDELAAGYVLTCQSVPTSARLVVDYDS